MPQADGYRRLKKVSRVRASERSQGKSNCSRSVIARGGAFMRTKKATMNNK